MAINRGIQAMYIPTIMPKCQKWFRVGIYENFTPEISSITPTDSNLGQVMGTAAMIQSIILGRSRKDPHSPHGGNFCRPEGEGRKNVSDSKCIRTSKGGRGVNIQFPPWGRYGCFLE
jgi:hypothetical protein